MTLYDTIGQTYRSTRQADPRIAAEIADALGDAASVVNVGAGAGSYEPAQTVAAIEPSRVMIAQRPPGSAPVVQAVAERIPLRDGCVDAAMAVLTVHHWRDVAAGVAEMRRIARRRLVFFTWDPHTTAGFWALAEYFPEAGAVDAAQAVSLARLTELLPGLRSGRSRCRTTASTASRPRIGAARMPTSTPPYAPECRSLPGRMTQHWRQVWPGWPTTCGPDAGTTTMPTCSNLTRWTSATAS